MQTESPSPSPDPKPAPETKPVAEEKPVAEAKPVADTQLAPEAPADPKDAGPAPDESKGKLVFSEAFDAGLDNWVIEKREDGDEVQVDVRDGKVRVRTRSRLHGMYLWLKAKELPTDYAFEFDFTPESNSGFFLIFFNYKGQDGEDILGHHLGKEYGPTLFKKYTKTCLDGYHISYRRNRAANVNFRKNSGMKLLRQKTLSEPLPADRTYHVRLSKKGNHFRLTVDDRVFMDFVDKGTLREGGRIGLRQVYNSEGTYDNIRLFEL
jgi:hypothetical protein